MPGPPHAAFEITNRAKDVIKSGGSRSSRSGGAVGRQGSSCSPFLDGKVAKRRMPDGVAFVTEIPPTATGKKQKTALRDRCNDDELPIGAT